MAAFVGLNQWLFAGAGSCPASIALDSLAFQILAGHVKHRVAGAMASGDAGDAQAKAEELLAAVRRL